MASRNLKSVIAPLTDACLENYFREIRYNKPLSRTEEVALMARIRNGEAGARELLIKANLRFVVGVSRNYQYQGLPLCDVINEGNLGLIRASMHFDETKNFKFISYAVWWIRQAILQALAEQSRIVRLPLNRSGAVYRIGKVRSRLEQRVQRSPEAAEIARELGMKEGVVRENMSITDTHVSLDAPLDQNDTPGLINLLHDKDQELPDNGIARLTFRKAILRSLENLSDREREIITMYFGIGRGSARTLDEIGRHFKLTRERIRQIKQRALVKLKKDLRLELLNNEY
ncbi:MAG: RNA polymerase sigma factor RpoD/SigA [Chitinispirillaceae bacterium]|nr:RNA polymerase sigma factor RpoD/SigA [Chitinispirillaceae bacterium]